tara:strand:- start:128 stop:325 length:198 start_codon:yes stop_codon:yes gene_type:complete
MFEEKIKHAMRLNLETISENPETEDFDDLDKFEMAKDWTVEDISLELSKYIDREFWSRLDNTFTI